MYSKRLTTYTLYCIVLGAAVLFSTSCRNKNRKPSPTGFSDEPFIEQLKSSMQPVDTATRKIPGSIGYEVRATYQNDDYQPMWLLANYRPAAYCADLLHQLEDMEWDGWSPDRYQVTPLKLLKQKLDTTKVNTLADAVRFDTLMTHSFLQAAKDLLYGYVAPRKADSLWHHANDSVWTAPDMLVRRTSGAPTLDSFRSSVPTYTLLRSEYKFFKGLATDTVFARAQQRMATLGKGDSGYKEQMAWLIRAYMPWLKTPHNDTVSEELQLMGAFQQLMALKPTGKMDSATLGALCQPASSMLPLLAANMERIRWMQRNFGNLYLIVNVPLMELHLRRDGKDLMHMNVIVGKQARQTPSLYARMTNLVINPPWGVPPTILKKDVLPGIQSSGKSYLAKKGLKAYDRNGKAVNPASINGRNYNRYTYKQAPGNDNALGYVKFNLPNPWDIYLHDTPHRTDFEKRDRALSSGCIRVQRPQEMALFILTELEKREYTQEKLDAIIKTHKTRWEILKNKIPVHITYLTAFEDSTNQHIRLVRDVYHRDEKLLGLLR